MRKFVTGLFVCLAVGFSHAQLPPGFSDTRFVSGFSLATALAFTPDGRLFVCQKNGLIKLVKNGVLQTNPFATISCETTLGRGLLGIAFDPQFATNPYVYLAYTAGSASVNPPPTPKNRVSRFLVNGDSVLPGSEEILVDGIASDSGSDNGGGLKFGADGKLYISTGQGSTNTMIAQDLSNLAGKVLRINSDGSVPADNPFFNQAPKRPEIWAYGFRNPFRITIRPGTSVPFVADVGEITWEELNVITRGANYGWPLAEGTSSNPALVSPAFSYDHVGISKCICGGVFTKSTKFPSVFQNRYVYGEYKQQLLKFVDFNSSNDMIGQGTFGPSATGPVDFAMGPDGSLYYVALQAASLQRITYQPAVNALNIPSSIDGGTQFEGSLTLNAVAPVASQRVLLSSSSPVVVVPTYVTLLSGSTTAAFSITTQAVSVATDVTITAAVPGASFARQLEVKPNAIKGLYVAAPTVISGLTLNATVGLVNPASQASVVNLTANSGVVTLPASIAVPAQASSKTFQLQALPVLTATAVVLSANWAGSTKTRALAVLPPVLNSLTVSANPIQGGQQGTGTVTLLGLSAGLSVALSDNTSLITTPSSVAVASGLNQASFSFGTAVVSTTVTRTMTASYSGMSRTDQITLTR